MHYNSTIYDSFLMRLSAGGALRLTLHEGVRWWIAALQRFAPGAYPLPETSTDGMPRLMVMGFDGNDTLFTEVNIVEDDPENLLDGTWWPIELWQT
jgi:hypothetical protein